MPLGSFIELKDSVADWLNRQDLTTRIPDFITLAEAEIRRRANVDVNFVSVTTDVALLTAAPDLYLYGALKHAAPFLEHDERIPVWSAQFEKALTEYNTYARTQAIAGAITLYSELLTAVDNWLGRGDLTNRIPTFVNIFESTLRRRLRRIKVRDTITLSGTSFDLTTLTTPCAEMVSLRLDTAIARQNAPIEIVSDTALSDYRALHGAAGRPIRCAIVGTEILFDRTLDASYSAEIIYFQAFASVTVSTTMLVQAPDLYLYGTLLQAAPYLGEDPRVELWSGAMEAALQELNTQRQREEFAGAPVAMRLPVVFG